MTQKWIIGTGLSRGIGKEVCRKFKEQGFHVLHLGRKKNDIEDEFLFWDLLHPAKENPIAEFNKWMYGKNIAGFFYAAGLMPLLDIDNSSKSSRDIFWQSQKQAMKVNYFSCAKLVEEILPFLMNPPEAEMPRSELPFIAYLSSLAAVDPLPGLELYGATKAAALHYFRWLANRFHSDELLCLSLHPGTVKTDMVMDLIQKEDKKHLAVQILEDLENKNKLMTPEESADKIVHFLMHEEELKQKSHGKLFLVDSHKIFN
jgi:benzil reductase ((S)-benzoin forming)